MIIGLVSQSDVIAKKFQVANSEKLGYIPNYNLRPGMETVFLSSAKPFEFTTYRYGLTPFWSKDEKILYEAPIEGNKIVAPGEILKSEIIRVPDFRKPIREQRGLLPVDYFIVQNNEGKPYIVFMRDKKRPFALGCVWDAWKMDILDPLTYGFAILTTPAYGEFASIGIQRMPLILSEYNYKKWLKTDSMLNQVTGFLGYYDEKIFNAYPLKSDILDSIQNEKTLIAPAGELVIQDKKEEIIFLPHGHKKRKEEVEDKQTLGERMSRFKP